MIVGLHHAQITVPSGQEQAAREFYCNILNLPEVQKPESLQSHGGFWLTVGDHRVHVGIENNVNRTHTRAHLAYEVTNLSKWRQIIENQGLNVLNGIPIPGFDRFEFRDPFGNRVELIQKIPNMIDKPQTTEQFR
ncbi:VOC family protein [Acaryochloris marina]|uniref:VOC family protein n=1 Tax=Acaryochloris marina TaxID=155978 RepID=UPI0021C33A5A|nr:VOC family protein [Acaryochloris marina]BDM83077.1 glyoxalase [Acaryochloris marina MBIC10699]